MRFFYLINSSDGVKKLSKKQQYSEKFFSEILIIYQYFNLMEYLDLIERVTIDE
jgi:ABC-type lipoprotein export system ATPase subunit